MGLKQLPPLVHAQFFPPKRVITSKNSSLRVIVKIIHGRVTASQSLSVSSLILTCSGKLWPIVAVAAGAGTLGAVAASFVVLRIRVIVLMTLR